MKRLINLIKREVSTGVEVILKSVSYLDGDSINSSIDDDITSIKRKLLYMKV